VLLRCPDTAECKQNDAARRPGQARWRARKAHASPARGATAMMRLAAAAAMAAMAATTTTATTDGEKGGRSRQRYSCGCGAWQRRRLLCGAFWRWAAWRGMAWIGGLQATPEIDASLARRLAAEATAHHTPTQWDALSWAMSALTTTCSPGAKLGTAGQLAATRRQLLSRLPLSVASALAPLCPP
jgi:hypothetical protein